jgi:hypothetical protein
MPLFNQKGENGLTKMAPATMGALLFWNVVFFV